MKSVMYACSQEDLSASLFGRPGSYSRNSVCLYQNMKKDLHELTIESKVKCSNNLWSIKNIG